MLTCAYIIVGAMRSNMRCTRQRIYLHRSVTGFRSTFKVWFKNRRAKCRQLQKSTDQASSLQRNTNSTSTNNNMLTSTVSRTANSAVTSIAKTKTSTSTSSMVKIKRSDTPNSNNDSPTTTRPVTPTNHRVSSRSPDKLRMDSPTYPSGSCIGNSTSSTGRSSKGSDHFLQGNFMGTGVLKNMTSPWRQSQPSYGSSYQLTDPLSAFHSGSNLFGCHSPQSFSPSSLFLDARGSLTSSSTSIPDSSAIFYQPSSFSSSSLLPTSSSLTSSFSKQLGSLTLETPYNFNYHPTLFPSSSSSSSPTFSSSSSVVIIPPQTYYGSAFGSGYSHPHLPPYPCGEYISSLPIHPSSTSPSPTNNNSESSYSNPCNQYASPGFFTPGSLGVEYSNHGADYKGLGACASKFQAL